MGFQLITGADLRAARTVRGWRMSELAARSGLSKSCIHRLETTVGRIRCHPRTYFNLQTALLEAHVRYPAREEPPSSSRDSVPFSEQATL